MKQVHSKLSPHFNDTSSAFNLRRVNRGPPFSTILQIASPSNLHLAHLAGSLTFTLNKLNAFEEASRYTKLDSIVAARDANASNPERATHRAYARVVELSCQHSLLRRAKELKVEKFAAALGTEPEEAAREEPPRILREERRRSVVASWAACELPSLFLRGDSSANTNFTVAIYNYRR